MAWIEVHQSLMTHRKVLMLSELLNLSTNEVIGSLVRFWCWALDNAPNGELPEQVTSTILARAADWHGDPDHYASALVQVGFLEHGEGLPYLIHDWLDYAGKLIDRRQRNAAQMREARARARVANVSSTCTTRESTCKATVPNRTQPNRTLDLSSRRGDLTRVVGGDSSSAAASAAVSGSPVDPMYPARTPGDGTGQKPSAQSAAFAAYWDAHAGQLNPIEAEQVGGLVVEFGDDWVTEAVREAVASGCRSPGTKYLTAVLQRWKRDGFKADRAGRGERGTDSGHPEANQQGKPDPYASSRALLRARGELDEG